ncbi:MAG: hypothetical protein GF399_06375 [Candidatus Coatesbacteria bacterium]|nr:hypothetical protein [Candidatus Coatesbacteria bacterium]
MEDRSPASAAAGRCPVHPSEPAVGVCLSCGRLICRDCRRRLGGRNICPECRDAAESRSERRGRIGRIAVLALVGLLVGLWFARPEELPPAAERLWEIAEAVETFRSDMLRWPGEGASTAGDEADAPDSADDGGASGAAGLRELTVEPTDTSLWFGPYLDDEQLVDGLPADVHGNPVAYLRDERGVFVASPGPDGEYQTDLAGVNPADDAAGDDLLAWVEVY